MVVVLPAPFGPRRATISAPDVEVDAVHRLERPVGLDEAAHPHRLGALRARALQPPDGSRCQQAFGREQGAGLARSRHTRITSTSLIKNLFLPSLGPPRTRTSVRAERLLGGAEVPRLVAGQTAAVTSLVGGGALLRRVWPLRRLLMDPPSRGPMPQQCDDRLRWRYWENASGVPPSCAPPPANVRTLAESTWSTVVGGNAVAL